MFHLKQTHCNRDPENRRIHMAPLELDTIRHKIDDAVIAIGNVPGVPQALCSLITVFVDLLCEMLVDADIRAAELAAEVERHHKERKRFIRGQKRYIADLERDVRNANKRAGKLKAKMVRAAQDKRIHIDPDCFDTEHHSISVDGLGVVEFDGGKAVTLGYLLRLYDKQGTQDYDMTEKVFRPVAAADTAGIAEKVKDALPYAVGGITHGNWSFKVVKKRVTGMTGNGSGQLISKEDAVLTFDDKVVKTVLSAHENGDSEEGSLCEYQKGNPRVEIGGVWFTCGHRNKAVASFLAYIEHHGLGYW